MDETAIDRLTDGQRACLRLVLEHKQTKEIARILGIAPDTVKQRLGIAMRALGVGTRVEAAILYRRHLEGVSPRGVYAPEPVADPGEAVAVVYHAVGEHGEGEAKGSEATFGVADGPPPSPSIEPPAGQKGAGQVSTLGWLRAVLTETLGIGQPEPPGAGVGNRLAAYQRILLIVLVAIGAILSLTGLVSAAKELVLLRR